jgi:hypothetical protein
MAPGGQSGGLTEADMGKAKMRDVQARSAWERLEADHPQWSDPAADRAQDGEGEHPAGGYVKSSNDSI